jgi:GNAT superfamily N-acetyltransferase
VATSARRATEADREAVLATLVPAFRDDPLWSWLFPDPDKRAAHYAFMFGLYVDCGIPNGFVWITDDDASAATIWSPPGHEELTEEADARIEPFVRDELGDHAEAVLETFERFAEHVPEGPPFYYLSLLGTRPDRRGQGVGMRLLAENLAVIDEEHAPAYLESSNPANNARYEGAGFAPHGEFKSPDGEHLVTTMWREGR